MRPIPPPFSAPYRSTSPPTSLAISTGSRPGMTEDGLEKTRRTIAALENALAQGADLEMEWDGCGHLPENMPLSYVVPLERIPYVLPILRRQLEQQEAFYRDLTTGLEQMRRGDVREELDI